MQQMNLLRRVAAVVLVVAMGTIPLAIAGTASADQAYHTERLVFEAVGGAPELRSGHVVNSHSNGPQRYAHEQYMVNGAAPNTTYQVVLEVFADSACTSPLFPIPTTTLATGKSGQASASATFVPADVAGLAPAEVSARWQLRIGDMSGAVAYQTRCTVITLDAPAP